MGIKMKQFIIILTVAFIILAGCTSDDGTGPIAGNVGKLSGYVYDNDDKPITGVKIATEPEYIEVTSGDNGYFEMAGIPAGDYIVKAIKSGYNQANADTKVAAGYRTTVKITMTQLTDENHPPEKPHSPNPDNESDISGSEYQLSWECSDPDSDPLTYDVYFGTDINNLAQAATGISEKKMQINNLQPGKKYYWRVVAKDGRDGETSGDTWMFSVIEGENHPPVKPHSPVPENGAIVQYNAFVLKWECSDPDGDQLTYDVYLDISNPPQKKIYSAIQNPSAQISQLDMNTKYYWCVIAKDGKGGMTSGDVWHFTTKRDNKPPVAPYDPNPADESVITNLNQKFTWKCSDPDGDVISYDIYFSEINKQMEKIASGIKSPEFVFPNLAAGKSYQWRVVAKDDFGGSATGVIWHFATKGSSNDWKYKLIAYYPFNGNGKDASGNQRDAHNNGAVSAKDRFNNENSCMYFAGLGSYMIIPQPQAFALQSDFTIAYWIKPNLERCKPWDTHIDVIGKSDFNGNWWVSSFTTNLGTEFWINNNFIGYDHIKLKDMNWNHVAVVFRRDTQGQTGQAELYLNGTKLGTSKSLPVPTNKTSNVWIGEREDHNASFAGWLDEMYFYDRALTPDEISQLSR